MSQMQSPEVHIASHEPALAQEIVQPDSQVRSHDVCTPSQSWGQPVLQSMTHEPLSQFCGQPPPSHVVEHWSPSQSC